MSKIPLPKVRPGQSVLVSNYRKKNNDWEEGVVTWARYVLSDFRRDGSIVDVEKGRWQYEVLLGRRTPETVDAWNPRGVKGGNAIVLTVGDEGVLTHE